MRERRDQRTAHEAKVAELFVELRAAGLSARVANILIHRIGVTSIKDLKARPWLRHGRREGLSDQLARTPGSGPKVLAEVEAFLAGLDPQTAPSIRTEIGVTLERPLLNALDAWIAASASNSTRAEAIRALLQAAFEAGLDRTTADRDKFGGSDEIASAA